MIIEETRVIKGKIIILKQIAEPKNPVHMNWLWARAKEIKPRSPKWFKAK